MRFSGTLWFCWFIEITSFFCCNCSWFIDTKLGFFYNHTSVLALSPSISPKTLHTFSHIIEFTLLPLTVQDDTFNTLPYGNLLDNKMFFFLLLADHFKILKISLNFHEKNTPTTQPKVANSFTKIKHKFCKHNAKQFPSIKFSHRLEEVTLGGKWVKARGLKDRYPFTQQVTYVWLHYCLLMNYVSVQLGLTHMW